MNYTTAIQKGMRPYQEDKYFVQHNETGILAAIFDGHGGATTSQALKNAMPMVWHSTTGMTNHKNRLQSVVRKLQVLVADQYEGSTGSIVWIPKTNKQAYVAIIGDSPVLIKDHTSNIIRSPEHNVRSNQFEASAAMRRGAIIHAGYMFENRFNGDGLQMTRAFGDKNLNKILNRLPEVYSVKLTKTSWILLGSDGLYDPGHTDSATSVTEIVKLVEHGEEAEMLVKYAIDIPTGDNVSAILIRMD